MCHVIGVHTPDWVQSDGQPTGGGNGIPRLAGVVRSTDDMRKRITILLTAVLLSGCSRQTLDMPSISMEPTIPAGSRVTIDLAAYKSSEPCRGDIVAFRPPSPTNALFAFRVIGKPGEMIVLTDSGALINGKEITLPGAVQYKCAPTCANRTMLKADEFFLLGDNTAQARDSRYLGPIKRSNIMGKVIGIEPRPRANR